MECIEKKFRSLPLFSLSLLFVLYLFLSLILILTLSFSLSLSHSVCLSLTHSLSILFFLSLSYSTSLHLFFFTITFCYFSKIQNIPQLLFYHFNQFSSLTPYFSLALLLFISSLLLFMILKTSSSLSSPSSYPSFKIFLRNTCVHYKIL